MQDDLDGKKYAICKMDNVYGHAPLTIVATSGQKASEGLPGIGDRPRPRMVLGKVIKGVPLRWRDAELSDMVRFSPYKNHAWTMQEQLLSRRCVYLSQQQISFHCGSDYECEDYHDTKFWEKSRDMIRIIRFPGILCMQCRSIPHPSRKEIFLNGPAAYIHTKSSSPYIQQEL